ncbi:putative phospholipid hydroperoxide glutathione peroxidase [Platanthera zijinensis]|uniref:Glutathione peroxidase n=1 Tax=Platanthera zijinensis TaxID=2320716 RepID=A0AAP0B9D5_9ASPA
MIYASFAPYRFISRRNLIIRVSSPLLQRREFSHRSLKTRVYPSEISSPSRHLTKYGSLRSSSSSSLQISFCSRHLSHMSSKDSQSAKSVHDFTVKDARGQDVDLSIYNGKVLLIVNVASKCGLTNSNYTELSDLYEKYKDKGLEILAFPCNQFGAEEPGSNEEILEFACTRFKAEFPIFDKLEIGELIIHLCTLFQQDEVRLEAVSRMEQVLDRGPWSPAWRSSPGGRHAWR